MLFVHADFAVETHFVVLKGVDAANREAVEKTLKEYRFDYRKSEGRFWIKKEEALRIVNTLRGDEVIGYPFVYYFPQTEEFVEPDDMDDVLFAEKTTSWAVIDELKDEKSKEEAKRILRDWKIPFLIYEGQIVIPREMEKKVDIKFKAVYLTGRDSLVRTFILCKTIVDPPVETPADRRRKQEERREKSLKEMISSEVLLQKDIFVVDVSMFSLWRWQVRTLEPQNYIWTEQQKKRIVERCIEKGIWLKYLNNDEVIEISFL